MTLGCGGYGGNITSDNISPRHLLNIKRLAYEITPVANRFERGSGDKVASPASGGRLSSPAAESPARAGVSTEALNRQIDSFLGSRGYGAGGDAHPPRSAETPHVDLPLEFVCEEDVRLAI